MNKINDTINMVIIKDQDIRLLEHSTGIDNMLRNNKN